jgi:hypothetical protein
VTPTSSRVLLPLACAAAAPAGAAWLLARRRRYRSAARPLPDGVAQRLAPCFPAEVLSSTRLARVDRIRNPVPYRLAPTGMLDLSTVRAMAFIDTIVTAHANSRAADDEGSLLFHELVHVVQFRLLGTLGFVHAYLRGWHEAGRSYLDNPLEAMAFELQDRFDAGEHPRVHDAVRDRLRRPPR